MPYILVPSAPRAAPGNIVAAAVTPSIVRRSIVIPAVYSAISDS
jgi:hypothetical protein